MTVELIGVLRERSLAPPENVIVVAVSYLIIFINLRRGFVGLLGEVANSVDFLHIHCAVSIHQIVLDTLI